MPDSSPILLASLMGLAVWFILARERGLVLPTRSPVELFRLSWLVMDRPCLRHLVLWIATAVLWSRLTTVVASPPVIAHLLPSGAQAGQSIEVTAVGKFEWPLQAWSSFDGVRVSPQEENAKLKVTVDSDTPPGIYWIRLYNDEGASVLRPFVVGSLREAQEEEPNNRPSNAQSVAQPATVNGRLAANGDVDLYSVDLTAGDTLVASVEANRHLNSPMDGILQLLSKEGFVLAQNDDEHERDPQIVHQVPKDGTYLLRLFAFPAKPNQRIQFSGGNDYVYRMTLTTSGFVDHVYPLVVPRRQPQPVSIRGWSIPEKAATMLPLTTLAGERLLVRFDTFGNTFPLRVVGHQVTLEKEPNGQEAAQAIDVPSSLCGRLDPAGDVDTYKFTAKKGANLRFSIEARSLGSPIDPALRIIDSKGNEVAQSDDADGQRDPKVDFGAPEDGEYTLEVRDVFVHGGWRYVYSVHITKPQPRYQLAVGADRFALTPGKDLLEIPVSVIRQNGFSREIDVALVGLPASVSVTPARSSPRGDTAGSVKLKLSASQGPFSGVIRIVGQEVGSRTELKTATFGTGGMNAPSDAIWLTVAAPEKHETEPPAKAKD
ncbi:MAG: PPC domain-containing protein [Planctomycetes bacterium]|nr:PPC domain-containing protein [Planctomycetota bacterium]